MEIPAFELSAVSKDYKVWRRLRATSRPAVRDFTLRVPRGIIFGLLGLNGAGKTTVMKLLSGILRPDRGTVTVLGHAAAEPAARARVGFLPEFPYLPLQLKARELLGLYGRLAGLSGRHLDNEVGRVMALTGADDARPDPLRFLSKGQLQRVAMAQVFLGRPEVIFIDEPMSGLDPRGVSEMRSLVIDLRNRGVTVFLSSHQVTEVERVCDRVGIMSAGRLVREGTVGELLALAGEHTYRVTALERGREGRWAVEDAVLDEAALAGRLDEVRRGGGRVLRITAQHGTLEEVMLGLVAGGGGARGA